MIPSNRREFLAASAAGAIALADLGFLLPLGRAAADDPRIDPGRIRPDPGLDALVRLILSAPRDECIPLFIRQLREGLSYRDFLSALLLAALEHGDPHQVAQVYSAHRIGSEARPEERLLPLFWALDRIKLGFDEREGKPRPSSLAGGLPAAGAAGASLRDAVEGRDPDGAERAIAALCRDRGPRRAMALLWEYAPRRVAGSLGHHPILVANSWRALEAIGWRHAEPVLRYIARQLPAEPDPTFAPNLARAEKALPRLRADWAGDEGDRSATLEAYGSLREGDSGATADLICSMLSSGKARAGAIWDAVHLAAADLIFRYRTGGVRIGGMLIHAVTATNALRLGFDCCDDDRVRLLLLLQGAGALGPAFIRPARDGGQLREMDLIELAAGGRDRAAGIADVFAMLPFKAAEHAEKDPKERLASDEACRLAFGLLGDPMNGRAFRQSARTFLCAKASTDPHDIKYPAAAFEDAERANPEWRPYLLAASVHALHGPQSPDMPALSRAREALR